MITSLALENGKKLIKNMPTGRFKTFLKGKKNILWLDMKDPSNKEFDILANIFDFHPLSIEDARKPQTLPKIDEFNKYIFIVFHMIAYHLETGKIEPKEIDIFLGKNFIVSVHSEPSEGIDTIMGEMEKKPHIMALGPDIILHSIIDYFIDQYFPILAYFDTEIERLGDKIMTGRTEKGQAILECIMGMKRKILQIRKSIDPQMVVINNLSRKDTPFISGRGRVYFRDVYDHIIRFYTELEMYRDLVASNFEAYVSTVSNRMNEVMKTLTVIATIFMPLTFIAGLYGMNFRIMPELSWQYGYFMVLAVMFVIAIVMYIFFRRKGWA